MQSNNKSKLIVMSLTLAMTLTNCATQVNNTANLPKTANTLADIITNNSINQINGTTHFPEQVNPVNHPNPLNVNTPKNRLKNRSFATKALVADVVAKATVSLLYPSDYSNSALRNVTIATGLTNAAGQFGINLGSFKPVEGTVYVLEAVKRLGGAGNYVVTLRTHVRWNGSAWESMTTPGIDLNLVTTGLAIISSLNPGDLPAAAPIGKVPVSGGLAAVNDINGNVPATLVRSVIDVENQVLNQNQDPFAAIYFSGGQYLFRSTVSVASDSVVNTYTNLDQRGSAIAMDTAGDFVIAWDGEGSYDFNGISAQRYNYAGNKLGSEFLVNTTTSDSQRNPAVAMDSAGDFVVTWQSNSQDGSSYGIFAQRYDSHGIKAGSEFLVNTTFTSGQQINPSVAMDSKGDFVISWQSGNSEFSQDGSYYGIFAQRYNSSGIAQGSEFQVNTFTSGQQKNPAIAMDSAGDFVISWQSGTYSGSGQDGSSYGIFAQRYNNSGTKVGTEFKVNTYTTNSQNKPAVAMDSRGDFVIAWTSYGQDASGYGIHAQRYSQTGSAAGTEFLVNNISLYETEGFPAGIAMDSNGNFVISWDDEDSNDDDLLIDARRFNSTGVPIGDQFQTNSETTYSKESPAVAMDSAGDFVVTWTSYGLDGYGSGIVKKRYNSFGIPQP